MGISFLKEKKIASFALGFLVLVFSFVEFFVVYSVIDFIRSLRFNNPFDGILSGIRFIFLNLFCNDGIKIGPMYICAFILLLIAMIFVTSILVTYILSGVIEFIKSEENKIKKENFIKVFRVVAIGIIFSIVFIVCVCVAILPALLMTSMCLKGKIELYYCVFFDFMTFLAIMLFITYIRIPIWKGLENAISSKKERTSDIGFKKLAIIFIVFDIIYMLTRVVAILFFVNFDGLVIRTIMFICLLLFNFVYVAQKTYSTLDILIKDTAKV